MYWFKCKCMYVYKHVPTPPPLSPMGGGGSVLWKHSLISFQSISMREEGICKWSSWFSNIKPCQQLSKIPEQKMEIEREREIVREWEGMLTQFTSMCPISAMGVKGEHGAGHLATRIFGYPVIWLPGHLATRIFGYPDIWLPGHLATRIFGYPDFWLPRHLATRGPLATRTIGHPHLWRTIGYPDIWLPGYLAIRTFGYPDIWLSRHLATRTFGYPDIWLSRHLATRIFGPFIILFYTAENSLHIT